MISQKEFEKAFQKAVEKHAKEIVKEKMAQAITKRIAQGKKEQTKAIIQQSISFGMKKEELAHRLQMPLAKLEAIIA